ncbi:MAG: hypothetical protein JXA30_02915 [Deltaproteobacteria bacterium]|nr:hypothetical protein [Deltaproteobacteria bacterium]
MRLILSIFIMAASIALTTTVFADALVVVTLRDSKGKPVEGKVTLIAKDKSKIYGCQTQKGSCDISDVPGGSYQVNVQLANGSAPPLREVMIPPSGKVELYVSAERPK